MSGGVNADDLDRMGVRKFMILHRAEDHLKLVILDKDISERPIYYLGISEDGLRELLGLSLGEERVFALLTEADITAMNQGGESAPGY